MEAKITTCRIEEGTWKNSVYVTYDDGSEECIFTYYPDEISFDDTELIGLTKREAEELKYRKDLTYLQN